MTGILRFDTAYGGGADVNLLIEKAYYQDMLKREIPVTCCTECHGAGYNIRVANGRCCRTIDGERCNGTNASALQNDDWQECTYCQATGFYRNKECPQCKGAGYLFARPRETQAVG
jgi:DnaJ-class molecular chaperone